MLPVAASSIAQSWKGSGLFYWRCQHQVDFIKLTAQPAALVDLYQGRSQPVRLRLKRKEVYQWNSEKEG